MKFLTLLITFFTLQSCGSSNTSYIEVQPDVLAGLKRKGQALCLKDKGDFLKTLQDKGPEIFNALEEQDTWEITYTTTKASDDSTVTHKITVVLHFKSADSTTLKFRVRNESIIDVSPNDFVQYQYTLQNHNDHVQMYIVDACEALENSTISSNLVKFEKDINSTTQKFEITDTFPAFFGRYSSFTTEIRSGDTESTKGSIDSTKESTGIKKIADSNPTDIPGFCYVFDAIVFQTNLLPATSTLTVANTLGIEGVDGNARNDMGTCP